MAQGYNQRLTGGRELLYLAQKDALMGSLFLRILNAVNNVADQAAVAAKGKLAPPPPINSIQVQGTQVGGVLTCPGEILHLTVAHNGEVKKGIQYITEVDTTPGFTQPHIIDHGCSRSVFATLPTKTAAGNPQTYYLRSYSQYHGSDPSEKTVLGGLTNPIQIQMGGNTSMDLLPSNGSGTAAPNGQQGGKGLGVQTNRPVQGPKRQVA